MERPEHSEGTTISWSEDFACPEHGAFMPELSPRVFHSTLHSEHALNVKVSGFNVNSILI